MVDFFFDIETRSFCDLKKEGAVRYALHPTTEPTLATWCFGAGDIREWRTGQPIHPDLQYVATHPNEFNFIAHNITFDYLIWTIPFARKIPGLIRPPLANLTDNMAITNHFGVGAGLEGAAAVLHMPYGKDKEGYELMLKQCKPNSKGQFVELTPEEWEKFSHYGKIDTKLMRETYYRMPKLPPAERWAWEWTFKRNLRGVKVDMELLEALEDILKAEVPKLVNEFNHLVGHRFTVTSRDKLLAWLQQYYPQMQNLQEETVRDTLDANIPAPPHARRVLEIKSIAGSTSISKVAAARRLNHEGRIYDILKYHEAHTKRWAGKGIQIQNFPRPTDKLKALNLNQRSVAPSVRFHHQFTNDGIKLVKNLLRRIWVPDEGLHFYCGDFSKVEPTVLFWLCDLGPIPKLWYEEMAAEIFGVHISQIGEDSEQRQLGKSTNLGSGYGMGPKKFKGDVKKKTGLIISDELAQRSITAYRRKYWQVPQLWKQLEVAFEAASRGQTVSLCRGRVFLMPIGGGFRGVKMRLPSGSFIHYHDAQRSDSGLMFQQARKGVAVDKHTYGGLLTEHLVSGTARDLLVYSMANLERAGFEVLNVAHDETWAQAAAGRDEEFEKTMCITPDWCKDLALSVGSKNGVRYLK